ncbi:hypothetical protein COLO4_17395 [Corchorus olitorius]|uniref:Uncharacterized protein n=1 Tax=Corchorus olitorius TaxID=93759 RepID=A0A1R3JD14_9ROSI|nr:hypothetical protein COLO4_17395 [Corchorus olitorius]
MAKFQYLGRRFTTEVAPPQIISVAKPPLRKMLATIIEEEKDFRDDEIIIMKKKNLGSAVICGKATIRLSKQLERSLVFLVAKLTA